MKIRKLVTRAQVAVVAQTIVVGLILLGAGVLTNTAAAPALTPGVWTNVGPAGEWVGDIQISPANNNILFIAGLAGGTGLKQSTDAGKTWNELGVGVFRSSNRIRIDPTNTQHLYCSQGVNGTGFHVSFDGGATWKYSVGMDSVKRTTTVNGDDDLYMIDVDPTDPNHFLLAFHNPWNYGGPNGILESFDGGSSFVVHVIPGIPDGWGNAYFLFNPTQGIGNNRTWLYASQGNGGMFRTTDAGATWSKVCAAGMMHGGTQMYYAKTGYLYVGVNNNQSALPGFPILRSLDNGKTWDTTPLKGFEYMGNYCCGCYGIQGDGTNLYTIPEGGPYCFTSREDDGITWKADSSHEFTAGSYTITYDKSSNTMYVADRDGGLWALRVPGTIGTKARSRSISILSAKEIHESRAVMTKTGIAVRAANGRVFDVKGEIVR